MTTAPVPPPVALSIAGSDPSGGAGLQADLKVLHQHGVYGTAAVSLLTVQDTRGVRSVHPVSPEVLRAQVETVLEDLPVAAAKTGALGTADNLRVVARCWEGRSIPLVVDPVLVSSSGARLLDEDALEVLRRELLPRCRLLTPNLAEAEALCGRSIRGPRDALDAARELLRQGCRAVLLKGGHAEGDPVDLLLDADEELGGEGLRFPSPRIRARGDHGTGCVLSAAITAHLARGEELRDAVEASVRFVREALRRAPDLGAGRGPLDLWAEPREPR